MTISAFAPERTTNVIPQWTLADRLRKAREIAGFDQGEFAEAIGASRQSLGHWESGRRDPKPIYLRAWADASGVSLHWIETGHEKTPANELTGVCDLCALTGSNRGPAD